MQPISSFLPRSPSPSDLLHLPAGLRTSDVLRVRASTETHADLTVLTAGGDRVTLSTESLLRASYTDVNFQSTDALQSIELHATASEVQRFNSIAVSVQGLLDQQEEADLERLVAKLQNVVKEFLGGNLDEALSKALQLDDLGTVASFQLHVQESEQIAITQKQSSSAHGVHALEPQLSLVSQIVDSIKDANIELSKLLKRLPQVLRQVFEEIGLKVSDKSIAELFSAVETLLRPDPTSPRIETPA
jgi:hypothetical protein